MMQIEYDRRYTNDFALDITVGATTRTGVRQTLPQPSPSDANSIWLAKNGNNGNPGTQASPKLTLNGAIAALGGAKTTVHIFRNGYVGDMIFIETSASTLGTGYNIQVEEGEQATIKWDSTGGVMTYRITMSGTNKINGLIFEDTYSTNPTAQAVLYGNSATLTYEVSNCSFYISNSYTTTGKYFASISIYILPNTGGTTIRNCFFSGTNQVITNSSTLMTIEDCIFYFNPPTNTDLSSMYGAITQYNMTGTPRNLSILTCIFSGYTVGNGQSPGYTYPNLSWPCIYFNYKDTLSIMPSSQTVSIQQTVFWNCSTVLVCDEATNTKLNVSMGQNLYQGLTILKTATGGTLSGTAIVITDVDQYDKDTPVMFINEQLASEGDIESYQLQRRYLRTPDDNSYYYIDSPLSDSDTTPFTYLMTTETYSYNKVLDMPWVPATMPIENVFTNPVNIHDVNGNLHSDYDTERRKFIMEFGDNIHISKRQMKCLRNMLADKGSKRFLPLGIGGNLFNYEGTGVSQGVFSSTDNSLTPVTTELMVPNNWRGFWVNIAGIRYYIGSNDDTKLYLVNKDNISPFTPISFPANGLHSFIIDSILVNVEASSYLIKQAGFTSFQLGGSWRENSEDALPYDYTIGTITLEEIEDHEVVE